MQKPVSLSFKYFNPGGEWCLSESEKHEIIDVLDCFRQTTDLGWQAVLNTGGKGKNKAGIACTQYQEGTLQHVTRPQNLSRDVNIFGLRASQGYRIFVGYSQHVL